MNLVHIISFLSAVLGLSFSFVVQKSSVVSKFAILDSITHRHFASNKNAQVVFMEKANLVGRSDLVRTERAPADLNHVVVIALKNSNNEELESILLDISNPKSV